jgi:hypothetical protein
MDRNSGCQIPCLPEISEGRVSSKGQPLMIRFKRMFALEWNFLLKPRLKRWFKRGGWCGSTLRTAQSCPPTTLQAGDMVRVKSKEEIERLLNRWKELKGCAFLEGMWQYCGTKHRVLKVMEQFLDERDYKIKKSKGIVLLEGVICHGTPVFGQCDRCCHLFWREEWLEKIR